ncbi:type IV pilus biogenesis protein PilI [Escherichia coli]|uniref:type IV pilus biogenesis protein PilI n=1 Tax=Escherichia coli TaxID=562 RepID=UPI00207B4AA3|nr:PilI type IV pilus biogenesis protein [Escherichia coli]
MSSSRLTYADSRHNPFPVFAACTALSAVPGIFCHHSLVPFFSQPVRAVMTVQLLFFPFRKESLMPQQHPGRLQVLVVNTHCERRLFSATAQADPDALARRFCTPDNCLVVVLRDNRFLFRLERAPGSHYRWHRGCRSRHSGRNTARW